MLPTEKSLLAAIITAFVAVPPASAQPLADLPRSIAREAARLAASEPARQQPQASQMADDRSWPGRHPVALGAAIGAVGGGIWGAAVCRGPSPCGDGHDVLLLWFGTGVGAAIGTGVGAIVSAVIR